MKGLIKKQADLLHSATQTDYTLTAVISHYTPARAAIIATRWKVAPARLAQARSTKDISNHRTDARALQYMPRGMDAG